MIRLKQYQEEAIVAIRERLEGWYTTYVEMPTGSGKTITFLSYSKKYHKKTLIIVTSCQLLDQVYESSLNFYNKSEISRKGNRYNESIKNLHICTIQSIRDEYLKFISQWEFDLIIFDEAHHSHSESYRRFKREIRNNFDPEKHRILGVTATPDRRDGQMLESILGQCSYKLEILDMIEQGYLSDIEGFSVKTKIDISDIDDHNGDFSVGQLYKKLCVESRNEMIIDIYKKNFLDRKTLIFCININHSKEINRSLNDNKISSAHLDGTTPRDERNAILNSFRNGEISVICNCQLLTEGFDEPSIDGIILSRPTRSRTLFTQMIGRGLRLFPGKKNCKIVDIVDGHKRLSGFNCIVEECNFPEINSFKSIKEIKNNISKEKIKVTEYSIQRASLLFENILEDQPATDNMLKYFEENNIYFQFPISFNEGSFLMWFNEKKKDYLYGNN